MTTTATHTRESATINLSRVVNTYGERNPDQDGGSLSQLTIAIREVEREMTDDTVAYLRETVTKHGDRTPDPDGGCMAQLTIAARILLDVVDNEPERTWTEQAHPGRTPRYVADREAANNCTVAGCRGKMTAQRLCDTCNRPHPLAGWDGKFTS